MAETELRSGAIDIVTWRRRQLCQSGFPPSLAARTASDPRVDLHALIELAEQGCPPDLAARILAPLGDTPRVHEQQSDYSRKRGGPRPC